MNKKMFVENSETRPPVIRREVLNKNLKDYSCEICKLSEWMDNPISLQLDHMNGVKKDNRLENLRWLCPNCHSQTNTFCGRNIKKKKVVKPKSLFTPKNKSKEWIENISISNRKVNRPSKEEMEILVEKMSMEKIGDKFGVSGNSARKWCRRYGIQTKPVGYWTKKNFMGV
jgi:hypothetical protein